MTHILIVDDNKTGIDVMGTLLSAQDVEFTGLQDPSQIRDALSGDKQYDVIFLDLEMPKLNGYEVIDIVKNELQVKAPVIAYSVHNSEIATVRELGFDGYLGKPLRHERFPDQLQRILQGHRIWET